MPSPEGEGRARSSMEEAWKGYYDFNRGANKVLYGLFPFLRDLARPQANRAVFDLVGFWLMWHFLGGFEGVQKSMGLSRAGMYRRIAQFREVFHEHPDVYEFPGVTIDMEEAARILKERGHF